MKLTEEADVTAVIWEGRLTLWDTGKMASYAYEDAYKGRHCSQQLIYGNR